MQGLSIRGRRLGLVVLLSLYISACSATGGTEPPIPTAHVAGVFLPATAAQPTITASPTETIPTAAIASATPTDEPTPTTPPTSTPEPSPTEVALEPFDPALAARLQQILDATVADGYIPGVVLAVQIPDQAPWAGASGLADRRQQLPMEPDTRVRIASISKVFTAVVVLQLIEEGRIALDAPMTTWLPDLVPNGEAITVRNLLNHTTGLYDFVEDRNFIGKGYQNPERVWEPRELVAYATQQHPAFAPGAENHWDYSSTNYVILGMIVEQVTGNTLAAEMRQRIFAPLELESTFFVPDEEVQGTQARGYSHGADQNDISLSIVFATANIVSTASDVQRFARAIVEGELLQPATQELLYRFVDGKGQYNMPDLAYGEGIMRNRLPVGPSADGEERPAEASTVVGHIGGFGGFRSAMWATPESGISIALAVNQAATDPNILATRVFDAILDYQGR